MELFHKTDLGEIYLGNSLELMVDMEDKSVNLIMTSPPLGWFAKRTTAMSMRTNTSIGFGHLPKSLYASSRTMVRWSLTLVALGFPGSRLARFITMSF